MKEDGGPAFPGNASKDMYTNLGMSVRDYFAAAALQGALATGNCNTENLEAVRVLVKDFYTIADIMIEERAK